MVQKKSGSGLANRGASPARAGRLPKVEIPDSVIDIEPLAQPRRPVAAPPAKKVAALLAGGDPFRAIGIASLSLGAIYGVLWALGALLTNGGDLELQQFNSGKPVMVCTSGGYRAVNDTLLGRIFGDRYFSCRDWKMGV